MKQLFFKSIFFVPQNDDFAMPHPPMEGMFLSLSKLNDSFYLSLIFLSNKYYLIDPTFSFQLQKQYRQPKKKYALFFFRLIKQSNQNNGLWRIPSPFFMSIFE